MQETCTRNVCKFFSCTSFLHVCHQHKGVEPVCQVPVAVQTVCLLYTCYVVIVLWLLFNCAVYKYTNLLTYFLTYLTLHHPSINVDTSASHSNSLKYLTLLWPSYCIKWSNLVVILQAVPGIWGLKVLFVHLTLNLTSTPRPWRPNQFIWPSYSITCSNLAVILQAPPEIWVLKVLYVWPWTWPPTTKTQSVHLLPQLHHLPEFGEIPSVGL